MKREILVYFWQKIEDDTPNSSKTDDKHDDDGGDGESKHDDKHGESKKVSHILSKKKQKTGFDNFLTFERWNKKRSITLTGDTSNVPIINSDDEQLEEEAFYSVNQHQKNSSFETEENLAGGVPIVDDIKIEFNEEEVKLWYEYHPRWGVCRCLVPFDADIKAYKLIEKRDI